jgi:hypothetical protein
MDINKDRLTTRIKVNNGVISLHFFYTDYLEITKSIIINLCNDKKLSDYIEKLDTQKNTDKPLFEELKGLNDLVETLDIENNSKGEKYLKFIEYGTRELFITHIFFKYLKELLLINFTKLIKDALCKKGQHKGYKVSEELLNNSSYPLLEVNYRVICEFFLFLALYTKGDKIDTTFIDKFFDFRNKEQLLVSPDNIDSFKRIILENFKPDGWSNIIYSFFKTKGEELVNMILDKISKNELDIGFKINKKMEKIMKGIFDIGDIKVLTEKQKLN